MIKPSLTPEQIKIELDKRVCGQDYAKTVFAVGVYKHLVRVTNPEAGFEKSNIILVGPTGCGKTELVRSLKQILEKAQQDIPVLIVDGSSYTESGVRGSDAQEILVQLIKQYGLEKAQKAIIYLDEFDKKCCAQRDYKGLHMADQYAILKMIEGTVVDLQEYDAVKENTIDTSNILFVLGGAFSGIENIIAARLDCDKARYSALGDKVLGLSCNRAPVTEKLDYNSVIEKIEPIDFLRFGVTKEVLGRLPYIAIVKSLSKKDFEQITHNFFDNEYAEIFSREGIEVTISDGAIEAVADEAKTLQLGARAIKSVLEPLMFDLLFEKVSLRIEKQFVHITKEDVLKYRIASQSC